MPLQYFTSFYVDDLAHSRVPLKLPVRGSSIGGGAVANRLAVISPATGYRQVSKSLAIRVNVLRHVCDALIDRQYKQKLQADA